ncbi:hypothetical protein POJ06DRAFT_125252 [Lipomyces tetrasporus]|uniref:Uncharacterized protein n=1 Tax=Lipomyces tetrasporus TaxID=54092 RepID=A0AAD7QRD7_9ASCO|nr:uncharacterized protein POJ06DRAFT_125252 [Lipomyces tetrasporus]KAJ8100152.1 hypothetical protein POJ06DRAFT_125252 [Lipomyces tetrasporus]
MKLLSIAIASLVLFDASTVATIHPDRWCSVVTSHNNKRDTQECCMFTTGYYDPGGAACNMYTDRDERRFKKCARNIENDSRPYCSKF